MTNLRSAHRDQRGFNLIELMIVNAIIGLLIGVGTLAWQAVIRSGNETTAAQTMKNRLRWQLRLTDEQMTRIGPIIDKTGSQLEAIRGDTGRHVRDVITQAHREIAAYLTPEQQQRLQQMEDRRQHWMQQHHGQWRRGVTPAPETSPETSPQ